MRTFWNRLALTVTLLAFTALPAAPGSAADLRDGVPPDVFLATYHKHNPERDYQKAYFENVWQTIEDTQICQRLLEAIQSKLSDDDREGFDAIREELTRAVEGVDWSALAACTESIYAQKMDVPSSQQLVLLRLPDGAAAGLAEGLTNLIKLVETRSNGAVSLVTDQVGGMSLNVMQFPKEVPMSLCVGTMDDVFLFSTSRELSQRSIELLQNPDANSKFDDPRLATALAELPAFEDGVTFFDGRALFEQLGGYSEFIRKVSNGNTRAEPVVKFVEALLSEFDGMDYEATVEYTEGFQNRSAAYGRILPGTREKLMGRMLTGQQPFADWTRWVPAEATSYKLSTGVRLQPLYAWLMEQIPAHFPEAQTGLDQFAQLQDQFDIHVDADLLQAFSGESVSISLPGGTPGPLGPTGQSVSFLRCEKPERIKELMHRLVDQLQQIPQLDSQNISLTEVEDLDGFEEISAGVFAMVGVRPVVGFRNGWMVCGSHASAVQQVLDTLEGTGESIADTEDFKKFNLDIEGPVVSIGYTNLAEQTRAMAMGIQQVGAMLPMIMGVAAQQGANLQEAQEFLALIPSIGRIIGAFDFYEAQLSVTQPGPDKLSYTRKTVTLVRPPETESE